MTMKNHTLRGLSRLRSYRAEDDDLLDEVLKEIASALLHADVNVRYVSELRTRMHGFGGLVRWVGGNACFFPFGNWEVAGLKVERQVFTGS